MFIGIVTLCRFEGVALLPGLPVAQKKEGPP